MIPIRQIKETCLYVQDLARTRAFYASKLGLPVIDEKAGRHIFFRAGTSVLLCFNPEATAHETVLPPHDGHGRLHLAFEVPAEAYEAAKQTLKGAGIEIEYEQEWPQGGRSCYFRDPDGHLLEFVQPGLWD